MSTFKSTKAVSTLANRPPPSPPSCPVHDEGEESTESSKSSGSMSLALLRQRDPMHRNLGSQPVSAVKVLKTKQNKRKKNKFSYGSHVSVSSSRSILPDEQDVILPYSVENELTNTGFVYASTRYQSNGIYDADPAIGGVSFTGLSEWAALYNLYRVISYRYELTICNREAFPMFVDLYNTNTDPGTAPGVNAMYYAMNAFGKCKAMGPLTGGRETIVIRGSVPLSALFGSETVETSPLFQGVSASSNPAELVYLGFTTRSAALQTAAGSYYTLKIWARVRFYDRVLLSV